MTMMSESQETDDGLDAFIQQVLTFVDKAQAFMDAVQAQNVKLLELLKHIITDGDSNGQDDQYQPGTAHRRPAERGTS